MFLREHRLAANKTLEEVGAFLGHDKSTIYRWEVGDRGVDLNDVEGFARAIGRPFSAMFYPPGTPPPSAPAKPLLSTADHQAIAAEMAKLAAQNTKKKRR